MYPNSRRPSANQLKGIFSPAEPTYMVGGNRYAQPWIGWFGKTHFEANPMNESRNGQVIE